MKPIELTDEEHAFLESILANIQISGNPDQVREMLALIDAIQEKIKAASEVGMT